MEEVKLAIKPYYQRKDINKDEYKDILRKAVHKVHPLNSSLKRKQAVKRIHYAYMMQTHKHYTHT